MILSSAPLRISFFGGGTDYPSYYKKYGGKVISTAIDKYVHVILKNKAPFNEEKFILCYSSIEKCNSIDEIKHPGIRATLSYLKFQKPLEMHIIGDIPAKTGLGSSSCFTVALLKALYTYMGEKRSQREIAFDAMRIEQSLMNDNVGSQDQYASAIGDLNEIIFATTGEITHTALNLPLEIESEFFSSLYLCFTGVKRLASNVALEQINKIENGSIDQQTHELSQIAKTALVALKNHNLHEFAHLLNETWKVKRQLTNKISNKEIDEIYEHGINCGATGGKLLGAGGGGFFLFFVPISKKLEFETSYRPGTFLQVNKCKKGVVAKLI